MVTSFVTQKYSRQGLMSLFLTCAFPFHFWALILIFRDISWVAERTNVWDAIGLASYGMVFALVESVLFFLFLALLGFLMPKGWTSERRIAFLGFLILLTAIWGMIAQLLFLWNVSLPAQAVQFLRDSGHPLRILYAAALAIVTPSILLPVYLFMRSKKSTALMQELMERLSLLTVFYLIFDLLSLLIVVLRNIR
jgi:hypothetical protein